MNRTDELIAQLDLVPHPEGGHYRETHRSTELVHPEDGRGARSALTAIYFLLCAGEVSRWHRVRSDESWIHLEGDPLELLIVNADLDRATTIALGPLETHCTPVGVVRAGSWQAARSTGAYTLVCCVVGPGFDFMDFDLLRHCPIEAQAMRSIHPQLAGFI